MSKQQTDLGKDKIGSLLFKLALPSICAQIINLLYNMIDRMYIGHIKNIGPSALTGVGVAMPVIVCISAFAALVSMGGAPLASINMGRGDKEKAENILGNCTTMLILTALILTSIFLVFGRKIMMLFGASENTIEYAWSYMKIYSLGTIFVQLALGLNAFINAQGFSKIAMTTVAIGALCNIILDPIFIFGFNMQVQGAALATVISQSISCIWILKFLTGKKTVLKIKRKYLLLKKNIILGAGADNFVLEFPQQDIKSKLEFLGDPYVIIDKPHNMFLQTGINDGCIALLVMIALFVLYVAQTIKRIFTDNNKYLQAVRYGLMAGCIAYMITGLTTDSVVSVAPVFWIMLGAGFGVNMIGIEKQEEKIK